MDQASRLRALIGGTHTPAADTGRAHPSADRSTNTCVIAVTSGKGGVGKTTVAVNTALLLAEQGARTLLVDADLGLANVDVMLGLDSSRHLGHLLLEDRGPEDVALEGPCSLTVISGGSGLRELADADRSQRALLLGKLREYYKRFDFVLIDTAPGIGEEVTDFLADAHRILLTTTVEPTALRDTYAATKTIRGRISGADPHLLVNMAASDAAAAEAVRALNHVAGKFLDYRYSNWHRIEPDPIVGKAISERRPLALTRPRSPAVVSLRRMIEALTEWSAPPAPSLVANGGRSVLAFKTS